LNTIGFSTWAMWANRPRPYNDSSWRKLDLPHDWSIELSRGKDNPTGAAGGYAIEGVGWYRKHFHAPCEWSGQGCWP
jgi:beta-galactosidase